MQYSNYRRVKFRPCGERPSLVGVVTLVATLTMSSTSAQEAGTARAAESPQLEEIFVTAQRRVERLQDVPVSSTVLSGDSLEDAAIRSLPDLANHQPNFHIQQSPGGDQLAIRGTGSGPNSGFEQSVGTFVDGLYRQRARSTRVALFDVERVEVLKGPQTIFFGANAIAGALNITTRKPTDTFEGSASALYSPSDGEYDIQSGIGGPLASNAKLRFAGRLSGMDGYIDNEKIGGEGPRARDAQLRLSASVTPVEVLTLDTRFDYARLRDTQTFNAEIVGCPPASGAPGPNCARSLTQNGGSIEDTLDYHSAAANSYSNIDLYEGEVTARIDLGFGSLVSTSGYFDQEFSGANDLSPFPGTNTFGDTGTYNSVSDRYRQYSQELRFETSTDRRVQFIGGVYYEHGDLDLASILSGSTRIPAVTSNAAVLAAGYTALSPVGYRRAASQTSRTLSGFGSVKVAVTDSLNVVGSLRYSDVRKTTSDLDYVYGLVAADGNPNALVPGNTAQQAALRGVFAPTVPTVYPFHERTDNEYMPGATVQYKFTPDLMAYGSYARGFKAGGFSGTTAFSFEPEKAKTYEAGFKALTFDQRLQTNIALFQSDYSNLQETQFVVLPGAATSTSIVTNAAESKSRGVELSVLARPMSNLTLGTDIAYLDAHYVKYPNGPCYAGQTAAQGCLPATSPSGQGQSLDGRTRPFAAKWSGNVNADYSLPIGAFELRLGTSVYFKSRYLIASSLSPYSEQAGYAKLDLRATLAEGGEGRWEVGIVAKNVLDKKTLAFFDDVPVNIGTFVEVADRPRSIALTASYKL